MKNKNDNLIREFGEEWKEFNYSEMDPKKLKTSFDAYFSIFPWKLISNKSVGFDMGCGSGRWAKFVAPRVGHLNCIDPSEAIEVAKKNLKHLNNLSYYKETTESCSLEKNSQDFGYCLGVLHHIPDTEAAINDCAKLLNNQRNKRLNLVGSMNA